MRSRSGQQARDSFSERYLFRTGAALDRAYMDSEVAMHQHVLNTIDQALLPQVRDASLKALVERMRTAVSAHLQDAETIRSCLGAN